VTNRNKITKNAVKLKCNNEKMHERIKQDKRMNAGGITGSLYDGILNWRAATTTLLKRAARQ
jgi:hypothetical protein